MVAAPGPSSSAEVSHSQRSYLLSLPAELRLEIYDLVFAGSHTIDLLLQKGPSNALRATCKFIHAESEQSYNNAARRHPSYRADLVDSLIANYEKEAVSPHRSIIFWPPLNRAATLMRSINDHCLHSCAKDGCYMCDDKAHRQCFDCGRNVAVALWCYDKPADTPALVEKGFGGEKLTPFGQFILDNRTIADRRMTNRVDKSKIDRWWQRELDMQRAIDYRCTLRRSTVAKYWAQPVAEREEFTADNMAAAEESDPGMAAYTSTVKKHSEENFLDWEPEYERRVKSQVEAAKANGVSLPPQIPSKRDADKLKALQARFKVTTLVGRFNTRVRSGKLETRKAPLHERREQRRIDDAMTRGIQVPSLVLAF